MLVFNNQMLNKQKFDTRFIKTVGHVICSSQPWQQIGRQYFGFTQILISRQCNTCTVFSYLAIYKLMFSLIVYFLLISIITITKKCNYCLNFICSQM